MSKEDLLHIWTISIKSWDSESVKTSSKPGN